MGTISSIIICFFIWIMPAFTQSADLTLVEVCAAGSFERATHIFATKQGTIYVLDADQNEIFLFANITQTPKSIGGFGWSAGSFDKPTGIATDGINVYVSDYGNHRIQRFDRNLNYISSFSTRDTSDQASMRFGYPLDVALSELGDLFILDGENLRILKFNSQQFFERSFGEINAGIGKLQNPIRLAVTTSRIFVGEQARIVIFDYFGNYLGSIGDGKISALSGFTLLENDFVVVSNDTLLWFSQDGAFQKSIPLSHIVTGEPIDRIQDIAFFRNQLYILSSRKLHVFRMDY